MDRVLLVFFNNDVSDAHSHPLGELSGVEVDFYGRAFDIKGDLVQIRQGRVEDKSEVATGVGAIDRPNNRQYLKCLGKFETN